LGKADSLGKYEILIEKTQFLVNEIRLTAARGSNQKTRQPKQEMAIGCNGKEYLLRNDKGYINIKIFSN